MQPLVESAITGMLEDLDPHSAYIGADEMKGVQESFEGEFSGIGVEFNILRDTVIVVNTIVGGPAERVGVQPNDRIVRIDTLDAVATVENYNNETVSVETAFLLVYAAAGDGRILRLATLGAPVQVSAAGKQFMADNSQREKVRKRVYCGRGYDGI